MGRWYSDIPFKTQTLNMLIEKSILFMRVINGDNSNTTHPDFLNALTNRMVNYLAKYMVRSNILVASGVASQEKRRLEYARAEDSLKKSLYSECEYIQKLFASQKAKRKLRAAGAAAVARDRINIQKDKAKKAYRMACQVHTEFMEAQNITRKK